MEKKKSKKLTLILVIAMLVVLVILGGTYAWLRISVSGSKVSKIKAGSLELELDETPTGSGDVRLEREVPKSYRQGILNKPYKFTLINNSTISTDYEITLDDYYVGSDENLSASDKIADSLIRYILVKNDDELLPTNSKLLSTGRKIDTGTIPGKSGNTPATISYTLYMWIDSQAGEDGTEADIMSKIFNARLGISAVQHNTAAPVSLQRDIWIGNNNSLCIKTLEGDKCISPDDNYATTKLNLKGTFGDSVCNESALGPSGTMYNCNETEATGYKGCYIQSMSNDTKRFLSCSLQGYHYKNMIGSITCGAANYTKAYTPIYDGGNSYNCEFRDYTDDSHNYYFFDSVDGEYYYGQ